MSNRFYVNGVQIFGNNEMYNNTYDELVRQGGKFTDDGILPKMRITEPQALMEAVTKDTAEQVRRFVDDKPFDLLTDSELLCSPLVRYGMRDCLYDHKKNLRTNAWERMKWYIEDKRVFTPYLLYTAIKGCVVVMDDSRLVLKPRRVITAEMY